MHYAIAVDSSADLSSPEQLGLHSDDISFGIAPMKVHAEDRHFADNGHADIVSMIEYLETFHGKSSTACPSTGEWIEAFKGAKEVFAVTISSNLSGSYNSAVIAAESYMEENPGARVHVVDSLATGPQMWLIAEKLRELMTEGLPFEAIRDRIEDYRAHSDTMFSLESLNNLANNGRVSPLVAKMTGMLGIRIVGFATNGELDPAHKARGEKKTLSTILKGMRERNYHGGKARIAHVLNEGAAVKLKSMIEEAFPSAQVFINETRALDSFYAERGGLIIGFEA